MSDEQGKTGTGWLRGGNRKVIAVVTAVAIGFGGVVGVQAFTDSNAYAHMKLGGGFSDGWRGGDRGNFGEWSDADIEARIDRMVAHVAIEIDATPEQQDKITALVTGVAKELKPVQERMRDARTEIHDLLLADTIDRTALEQLRADRIGDAEQVSTTLVDALADAAEILSPEQRKMLDERFSQFRSMQRGWHRG